MIYVLSLIFIVLTLPLQAKTTNALVDGISTIVTDLPKLSKHTLRNGMYAVIFIRFSLNIIAP